MILAIGTVFAVCAVSQNNMPLTREFLTEIGIKGRESRWSKFTKEERSEQMRLLSYKRHKTVCYCGLPYKHNEKHKRN